jgi:hypothetical protein
MTRKERYASDPAYRAECIARAKADYEQNKDKRKAYARERHKELYVPGGQYASDMYDRCVKKRAAFKDKYGDPTHCGSCKQPFSDTLKPYWDHDHALERAKFPKEDQFRAFLCYACNFSEGQIKTSANAFKLYQFMLFHELRREALLATRG